MSKTTFHDALERQLRIQDKRWSKLRRAYQRKLRAAPKPKFQSSLLNIRINNADRKLFRDKAELFTNGNITALILIAVKVFDLPRKKRR